MLASLNNDERVTLLQLDTATEFSLVSVCMWVYFADEYMSSQQ
jgi:hypothetical protein